jgi:UPF0176 protein
MKSVLKNKKPKEELLAEIQKETFKRKTLSFYRYVKIADPKAMRDMLFAKFDELGCKGRIYVAHEGINAQMNVPEPNFDAFDTFLQSIPEFKGVPYKIAVEEKGTSSFLKLTIKIKEKIVADGLDDASFDPSNTGEYATAEDVNDMIDRGVTVIDMRNAYEAEVGHFEKAKIMNVDTFREQLATVEKEFKNDKDKEVLLYCTGGIRCEKASAWMKHQGFGNVKHIKGGIIDYAHQVKEKGLPNKFKGKNFVFDERLGERISDEIISDCHLCQKVKCDDHTHCKNQFCHMLFIGCSSCLEKGKGYCSSWCRFFDGKPMWVQKLFVQSIRKSHGKQFRKNYFKNKKFA